MKKIKDMVEAHGSARDWVEEGETYETKSTYLKCIKKVIMPTDKCPHCKGSNTFHKIAQIEDNVWRMEDDYISPEKSWTKKWDFCLDCHKEFLIEAYLYLEIPKAWIRTKALWWKLTKK